MADLPIITPKDLSKVPQSTEDVASHVISYSNLASYYFAPNIIYKADDVFIVDNNLNLNATAIAKDANDDRIPADILFKDIHITATVTPTAPTGTLPLSAGTAELLNKVPLYNYPGTAFVTALNQQQGGMSWISVPGNSAAAWGDHARAFDQGATSGPMIAGVQNFTGGNGAGVGASNIYYLGASIAGYPLYSASMAFRALGYSVKGLGVALDYSHGFLQIGAGTLTDWYGRNIRIPQNSKQAFYYTHGQTILNSPGLVVTEADLHRRDNNGTLIATVMTEVVWHFVYLEPATLNIYIVLWSNPTAIMDNGSDAEAINDPGLLVNALHFHSQTTIPDFLRENGVLLACIATGTNRTFNAGGSPVFQMHNFTPGNGNSLNPGVPSPQDFPYGGTLKAKNNVFELDFDYDSYLIDEAAILKNNYLFIYDTDFPIDLATSPYQTARTPLVDMIGMMSYTNAQNYSDNNGGGGGLLLNYSYVDRSKYPASESQAGKLYTGAFQLPSTNSSFSPEDQASRIINSVATLGLYNDDIVDPNNFSIYFVPSIGLLSRGTFNGKNIQIITLYCGIRIPGASNLPNSGYGYVPYNDAFRARRVANGVPDSFICMQHVFGAMYIPNENDTSISYLRPDLLSFVSQLTALIGASLVQQIKEMHAKVKQIGLLSDITKSIMPIVGYGASGLPATSRQFSYSVSGLTGIKVTADQVNLSYNIASIDPNCPIVVQPADVVTLQSPDLTPFQATLFILAIRSGCFSVWGTLLNQLQSIRFQATEIQLS